MFCNVKALWTFVSRSTSITQIITTICVPGQDLRTSGDLAPMFSRRTQCDWPRFGWTTSSRFTTTGSTTSWEILATSQVDCNSDRNCNAKGRSSGLQTYLSNVTGNVPSFQWYLDTVYPEQFVPTKAVHQVELQTKVHTKDRNQGSYSGLLRDYEIFANLHLTSV